MRKKLDKSNQFSGICMKTAYFTKANKLSTDVMIIIVMGLPGSGKSYFAEQLARAIGADYVNSDRVRKRMISTRTYSAKEKLIVYNEMIKQMHLAVQQKKDIVLDGTFYRHSIRKMFMQKARRADGIVFIEVRV